jgi:hypothetical protein
MPQGQDCIRFGFGTWDCRDDGNLSDLDPKAVLFFRREEMKKIFAVLFAGLLAVGSLAGCASMGATGGTETTTTVNQTTIENIKTGGAALGAAVKTFIPLAGAEATAGVTIGMMVVCNLQVGNSTEAIKEIKTQLGTVWTDLNSLNTEQSNAAVLAINTGMMILQGQLTGVEENIAVQYVKAFLAGVCAGWSGGVA